MTKIVSIKAATPQSVAGEAFLPVLQLLLDGTQNDVELRAVKPGSQPQCLFSRSTEEILDFCSKYTGQRDVYFGAATRQGGGKKVHCREAIWLWVDIDYKDFPGGEEVARKRLNGYPLPPSMVLRTGGGLHVYWLLQSPVENLSQKLKVFEDTLRGLVAALNADKNCAQIASLMRVPGTVNMKPERHGAVCELELFQPDRRYAFSEFTSEKATYIAAPETSGTLAALADQIVPGNRDQGAMEYINAAVKLSGAAIDDDQLTGQVTSLLEKAGGNDIGALIKKIPYWVKTAHEMFDQPRQRSPLALAETIRQSFDGHLLFSAGRFRAYTEGYWRPVDEESVIRRRLAEIDRPYTSGTRTNNALRTLKDIAVVSDFQGSANLLCLANGTLDLESGQLVAHDPDHRLGTRLNIIWHPDASCPLWLKTLAEVFQGDTDAAQKIDLLRMWFGYCLVPDNSQQRFLWLVGNGANGKSLILGVLEQLVGPENVSHAMMTRLGREFVRAELEGKLVNISAEMKAEDTLPDGYLKAIVGGDPIEAERKFAPSFTFKPVCRVVAATNELPRLRDYTMGFRRRAIILSFNRVFAEHEQDHDRLAKLITELPGILKWAVAGLSDLRKFGSFAIPPSSAEALREYVLDSDPVGQFRAEELIDDAKAGLQAAAIFSRYSAWAKERGYREMNIMTFGRRLSGLGVKVRHSNGKKLYCVCFSESLGHAVSTHESSLEAELG